MVPQNIDPITAEPHPPPQFVVAKMPSYLTGTPELQLVVQGTQDGTCHCELEFSRLYVYEADPTIDLDVRWFLDYNVSVARSTSTLQPETIHGVFDDPNKTERLLSIFYFDAAALAITGNGSHVLEVVVGEAGGFDDSPNAAQPNRTMLDGFIPAVYRFFINVSFDPVVGFCAQNGLPSVQVCQ